MSMMTFAEVCEMADDRGEFAWSGKSIFLDLDGLMVDDHGAACKTAGRELVTPGQWEVDFDFDNQPYEWWMANEPTEELQACLAILERRKTFVCTARPVGTPGAQAAWDWLYARAPWLDRRRLILCRDKWLMAGPDRVLVDDSDHNIAEWTCQSGIGCLIPRLWNEGGRNGPKS